MYNFPELIKKIRKEAGMTQAEFAKSIDASPVLIAMIESGQKEVSKKLLQKIADKLDVHPSSITPFLYGYEPSDPQSLSPIEKQFLSWGSKFQEQLIMKKSRNLKNGAQTK